MCFTLNYKNSCDYVVRLIARRLDCAHATRNSRHHQKDVGWRYGATLHTLRQLTGADFWLQLYIDFFFFFLVLEVTVASGSAEHEDFRAYVKVS